jgi:exodeoxyribonuclease V gamma subunit
MTPEVEAFAPLVAARCLATASATGVVLPWRLTDRSQQSRPGHRPGPLPAAAAGRWRGSASPPLPWRALLEAAAAAAGLRPGGARSWHALHRLLQQVGFRWGLDGRRAWGQCQPQPGLGDAIGCCWDWCCPSSRAWPLPTPPPMADGGSLDVLSRWLAPAGQGLRHWLTAAEQAAALPRLGRAAAAAAQRPVRRRRRPFPSRPGSCR